MCGSFNHLIMVSQLNWEALIFSILAQVLAPIPIFGKFSKHLNAFANFFFPHAPNTQSQSVSWWNTPMMKCCVDFDVCSTELKHCLEWVCVCVCALRYAGLRQSVEHVESRSRLTVPRGHCQIDVDVQEHSFEWVHFFFFFLGSRTSTATRIRLSGCVLRESGQRWMKGWREKGVCLQTAQGVSDCRFPLYSAHLATQVGFSLFIPSQSPLLCLWLKTIRKQLQILPVLHLHLHCSSLFSSSAVMLSCGNGQRTEH